VDTESTGGRVKGKPAGHTQDTRLFRTFRILVFMMGDLRETLEERLEYNQERIGRTLKMTPIFWFCRFFLAARKNLFLSFNLTP